MQLRRLLGLTASAALLGEGLIAFVPGARADSPGSITPSTARTAISAKHDQLTAAGDPAGAALGTSVGSMQHLSDGAGYYQAFQHGAIYALAGGYAYLSIPSTSSSLSMTTNSGTPVQLAVHEVSGPIYAAWQSTALGGEHGLLGYPVSDEQTTQHGAISYFQFGAIYWSPATGAHALHGAVLADYLSVAVSETGGPLGWPTAEEQAGPAGGRISRFQNGAIYWSSSTGAYALYGGIYTQYNQPGVQGELGYPVSDVLPAATGAAWMKVHFAHGWIFWGAFADGSQRTAIISEVSQVGRRWAALGDEQGIGAPLANEADAHASGRYQRFTDGAIYWSPAYGAHAVLGTVYGTWAGQGAEAGALGYPTDEAHTVARGSAVCQPFEHGAILEGEMRDASGTLQFQAPRTVLGRTCLAASTSTPSNRNG